MGIFRNADSNLVMATKFIFHKNVSSFLSRFILTGIIDLSDRQFEFYFFPKKCAWIRNKAYRFYFLGSVHVSCDPSVVDETLNSRQDGALGASRRTDRHAAN